jgi:hypothetical protein
MCAISSIFTFIPLIFLFFLSLNAIISTEITNKRADKRHLDGAIIFLDISKAFDSLEWDFMLSTLKHYGFNYSFVTWVETLYNNIQT